MNPAIAFAEPSLSPVLTGPAFAVRRSPELPAYYELTLEDAYDGLVQWVIPLPLKQLVKRPVLLWLLPATPLFPTMVCVDSGPVQLAAGRPGVVASLRAELTNGLLRLHFQGQRLRGYFRLQCLPTGCGQLWQLTPIGHL